MTENQVELLASYWTIAGDAVPHSDHEYSSFSFHDRVKAASKAGFRGIGLWHSDLEHLLASVPLSEMRQILDDYGIQHLELEFLLDWFTTGDRKQQSDRTKHMLLTTAQALGARHIKVGDFSKEQTPMSRLVDSFAALCSEAKGYGTKVGFELMPFAMIDSLEDALALVEGAGAENGGIAFDLWHMAKLGISNDKLAEVPARYIISVEVNDGTYQAPWSLHEDTINHRRLCGEGEFDVPGFIHAIEKAGYKGPYGIEVLSREMRSWTLEELTQSAFQTTIKQFQEPVGDSVAEYAPLQT